MNLGGPELIILIGLAVLVFGAGWLPKAARNLGKAKVEFDAVQQQLNDTKEQVIEATGVKELDATLKKANKALNTTPQGLMKSAAASAMKPATNEVHDTLANNDGVDREVVDTEIDDAEIIDAEIVDEPGRDKAAPKQDTNVTIDFSD